MGSPDLRVGPVFASQNQFFSLFFRSSNFLSILERFGKGLGGFGVVLGWVGGGFGDGLGRVWEGFGDEILKPLAKRGMAGGLRSALK